MRDPDLHATDARHTGSRRSTANDRLKERFGSLFWGGLAAAVVVHFAIFLFAPPMTIAEMKDDAKAPELVDMPIVDVPEPPREITRPVAPVPSEVALSEDVTIPKTTFDETPPSELRPPPASGERDDRYADFVPTALVPEFRDPAAVRRALERAYPPLLRDAGIGGRVDLRLWIDETGRVVRARVHRGSGHAALDRAALEAAETMRFRPAMNRDRPVAVTALVPVVFQTR